MCFLMNLKRHINCVFNYNSARLKLKLCFLINQRQKLKVGNFFETRVILAQNFEFLNSDYYQSLVFPQINPT